MNVEMLRRYVVRNDTHSFRAFLRSVPRYGANVFYTVTVSTIATVLPTSANINTSYSSPRKRTRFYRNRKTGLLVISRASSNLSKKRQIEVCRWPPIKGE